jgi:hypothetical protein
LAACVSRSSSQAALARPDDVNRRILEFLQGEHRAQEEGEDVREQSRILQ